jgi:hypothetical protein
VTCALTGLTASFSIDAAFQDVGPPSNATVLAVLGTTTVSGIMLGYQVP